VPCDFVCEGIFASAVSGEIRKPTLPTFLLLVEQNHYFEPIDEGAHIRPNDAQHSVLPKTSHNPQQYPVKCVVRGPS
jgi:hypothetical protein